MDPFYDSPRTSREAARRIGTWLEERPEVQKAVVADYVSRSPYPIIDHRLHEILYGSSLPPSFGDWCLRQAREAKDPHSAETYLRLALARGVRLDILLEYERETPPLREIMEQMLVCPLPDGFYDGGPKSATSWREESSRRRQEFVEVVRSHETELRANRGGVRLLDELANVYFGGSSDVRGHSPHDRLRDLFGDEPRLIDATLAGFRGAPFRGDIPRIREIVGLLKTGRQYRVALPVLAGVDELADLRSLTDRQIRQALAFHFCTFTEDSKSRGKRLLEADPPAAADVLVRCTKANMDAGNYDSTVGYELAVGEYVTLASVAVLPLLRSFSVRRAQPEAMAMLDELFIAALLHADRVTFLALAAEKLACTSMSAAQRLRWLAVQVVAAPDTPSRPPARFRCTAREPGSAACGIPVARRSPTRRPAHADAGGVHPVARTYLGTVGPDGFLQPARQIWTGSSRLRTADGSDTCRPAGSRHLRRARTALHGSDIEQVASHAGRCAGPPARNASRRYLPASLR